MPMPIQGETSLAAVVRSLRELWILTQNTPAGVAASIKTVNVQVFTASGTYTPTAGMVYCRVRIQAAGGGSGGADGNGATGTGVATGGGGAGEYAEGLFTAADIGASKAVTIGAVGAAGNNTGGNGGNASASSLGSLITASGGSGSIGTGSDSTNDANRAGGAGGSGGTGGYLHVPGQAGESSGRFEFPATNTALRPGAGGSSQMGRGGQAAGADINVTGTAVAGGNYGGGASGARAGDTTGIVGAAGGPGIIIIEEFIAA